MSNRWTKVVPVALALHLIIAGCGNRGSHVDQRSYDAGYNSGAQRMVKGGRSGDSSVPKLALGLFNVPAERLAALRHPLV
jgi:hypothetical protein